MYRTTRKKNVALFACSEVCGSRVSLPWLLSASGGITGVALSFLMSCKVSVTGPDYHGQIEHLLERLVVHETGGIFWNLQLPFLDVLAKLPGEAC
jgi:hypothetical protein